jgi:hypothetical protein
MTALLVVFVVSACSGPGSGSDGSTDADTDNPDGCVPEQDEDLDLLGVWGARSWIRVELETSEDGIVRMCPSPHPGITYLTLLITLREQAGSRIDYDFVVCEIDMPRVRAAIVPCDLDEYLWVNLELGPALAAYIPTQVFEGHADIGGDGPCSSYVSHMDITYGYDAAMVDPLDPLPGWEVACGSTTPEVCVAAWDTVIDEDSDGHPGVSLQVSTEPIDTITGQAYTTWRTNPHMSGVAVSNVLIQGELAPMMEYDVVGSGAQLQGLHMDEKTVKRNLPIFILPSAGSTFRMVRVDGLYGSEDLDTNEDGEVDCEELMSRLGIFE